ncbi:MAG: hypothetical protein WCF30_10145 [Terracidiphilus sp.]
MFRKSELICTFVLAAAIPCSGCFEANSRIAPTVCGVYSLHSDSSIRHGVDILILDGDSTYMHAYTKGSSKKDLMQSGTWMRDGNSIDLSGFVAWDLGGPLPDGVMYPDPAGFSSLNGLKQEMNGDYEINVNPDRDQRFVQIERFAHCSDTH